MGYDEVIGYLGDFGRYQRRIYLLLCLPAITCAFHKLSSVFLQAEPLFRCLLPFEDANNASYNDLPLTKWPLAYEVNSSPTNYSTCNFKDVEYTLDYINGNISAPYNGTRTCNTFIYDRSVVTSSAVIEWNMVCDRTLLSSISDSLLMVGVLLGSMIFGQLSDKYGRKPTFFTALVLQVVFGVVIGVAPNYYIYTLARIIVGSTTSGVFLVAYVIAMEMVGSSKRLLAGVAMQMFFSLGYLLTAGLAYLITDWRWLQIALSLPGLLFMGYYWLIPESVRWLLMQGRQVEAVSRIQHAARVNGVQIPPELLDNLTHEGTKGKQAAAQSTVFDLLKYPNLRRKTLLIFLDWFVNNLTYYGVSWNTSNLGGNHLLNFAISGAVEFPAYTFLLFTLNRWGRRSILCGCMLVAGVALMSCMFVPQNYNWLLIVFVMIGKMAITASYATVYIFSAEQFPTVVRNAGLGASSMVGRFGAILSTFLKPLGNSWRPLPLIICGALTFIGGLLSLLLPETLNMALPETIADGENFGKKGRSGNNNNNATDEEFKNMLQSSNNRNAQ